MARACESRPPYDGITAHARATLLTSTPRPGQATAKPPLVSPRPIDDRER